MPTTIERPATDPEHAPDQSLLAKNVRDEQAHRPQALCPCGTMASVFNDGYGHILGLHAPKTEAGPDGQQRPVISDAYGAGGCRYSLRTITLDAALRRDNILGPAEQNVRDNLRTRLERGLAFTAPQGYTLPTEVANLFALADANRWATVQEWEPTIDGYGYVLHLRVGRADNWHYDLCLFMTPDVALETGYGRSCTPDRPFSHITPSFAVIRKVVTRNPLPKGADLPYVGSPHIWGISNSHSSWWLEP